MKNQHAEVDQLRSTLSRGPLEAVELGHRGAETDLESFDLSEPAVSAGFRDALAEVLDDLQEAGRPSGTGHTLHTGPGTRGCDGCRVAAPRIINTSVNSGVGADPSDQVRTTRMGSRGSRLPQPPNHHPVEQAPIPANDTSLPPDTKTRITPDNEAKTSSTAWAARSHPPRDAHLAQTINVSGDGPVRSLGVLEAGKHDDQQAPANALDHQPERQDVADGSGYLARVLEVSGAVRLPILDHDCFGNRSPP